jgi:DNA helicase HerA-like ATPase
MTFADIVAPSLSGHVLVAAPTGGGKSYLVGALIEQLDHAKKPYVILDTKSQNHIGLWVGKNRLKKLNLFRCFPDTDLTVDEYKKMLRDNPRLLCIPTTDTTTDHLIEEYKKILKAVQNLKLPRHVIVEETHNYCKSSQKALPEIEWIVREGRGYMIWLWSITQRIQSFPKDVWANGMWTYIMHMRIRHDVEYFDDALPDGEDFRIVNEELKLHDVLQLDQISGKYQIIKAADITRKTQHLG